MTVDGRLDEAAWARAARLGGFSAVPAGRRPAGRGADRGARLVLADRAALRHHRARPRARLRPRHRGRPRQPRHDDTVTIYLDTFNDRRRAFFFAVNPLGVQQDGVQSEAAFSAGTHVRRDESGSRSQNPDFQFDSRGRLTDDGYVVEVRIPFKSLRYRGNGPQTWGFNIQRKVQRTGLRGHVDRRAARQRELPRPGRRHRGPPRPAARRRDRGAAVRHRGRDGARDADRRPSRATSRRQRRRRTCGSGSPNLSLDATVNPDFSQVEADAGQVTVNERFALFYPEKRPFFLEGIDCSPRRTSWSTRGRSSTRWPAAS